MRNVFSCRIERIIEDVFSYILIVSPKEGAQIRVDVSKEEWLDYRKRMDGDEIFIGIEEKDIMLLK